MLRGTFGGTPPDFLQSIIQAVAGQVMGGVPPAQVNIPTPATSTTAETSTCANSTQAAAGGGANINSQARSNTQTHPTTSTQTRSTPRPHVHLAQHTMQGFDPFLPCNSHHIRRRRPAPGTQNSSASNTSQPTESESQNNNQNNNPFYNMLQGFLRTVGNHVGRMQRERPATQENASTAESAPAPEGQRRTPNQSIFETLPPFSTILTHNLVSLTFLF